MSDAIPVGSSAEVSLIVTNEHTAARWHSGVLDVFSTPYMVAMMEQSAVKALDQHLPEGQASVGILVDIQHLAATPVSDTVTATARIEAVDGRKVTFAVEARDSQRVIGKGRHQRFIIDIERFIAKTYDRDLPGE